MDYLLCAGALKSLAMHEDSRGRLLKGVSSWDLKGLPELIATTVRDWPQSCCHALDNIPSILLFVHEAPRNTVNRRRLKVVVVLNSRKYTANMLHLSGGTNRTPFQSGY